MSTQRTAVSLVLCVAATAMLSVRADQPVNLNVDMGLWEVTAHAQTSGMMRPQMQQNLPNMTPEQRARIMAAMQAATHSLQGEHVFRECMTPERLSRGFDTEGGSQKCKSTLISNTRTDFELRKACVSPNGSSHTEKALFHMSDRRHLTGTIDAVVSGGGHPMKVHEILSGRWLGSSCGAVKDVETVR